MPLLPPDARETQRDEFHITPVYIKHHKCSHRHPQAAAAARWGAACAQHGASVRAQGASLTPRSFHLHAISQKLVKGRRVKWQQGWGLASAFQGQSNQHHPAKPVGNYFSVAPPYQAGVHSQLTVSSQTQTTPGQSIPVAPIEPLLDWDKP